MDYAITKAYIRANDVTSAVSVQWHIISIQALRRIDDSTWSTGRFCAKSAIFRLKISVYSRRTWCFVSPDVYCAKFNELVLVWQLGKYIHLIYKQNKNLTSWSLCVRFLLMHCNVLIFVYCSNTNTLIKSIKETNLYIEFVQ